jgi:hypothetical protein
VHDTVGLENEGVPSVFVASDEFTHPIQDANDQEMASKADEAIDSLLGALTGEAD